MKKLSIILTSALLFSSLSVLTAQSDKGFLGHLFLSKKKKAEIEEKAKETPYQKLLKDSAKKSKGIINLYYKKEKLYMEVPFSILERDMLLGSTISELSDNNNGIVGSKPSNPLMVQFAMSDSTIQLRKIETVRIAPDSEKNINEALKKNSIGAIIKIFKIKAFNADTSAAVIDATDFFLSDNKDISPFGSAPSGYTRTESFKKDRSYIGEIKAFDDNLTIKSHLSYEYTLSKGDKNIIKNKPFTATLTRTLLLLPDKPARPRIADPRIGIFVSQKSVFSNEKNRTDDIYYAHRFNLLPSDSAKYEKGILVEPIKKITFYVDSDFPASWRESVKAAVNDWNKAFEKIGFKNAIEALDYPDNPDFDPDNLKYNCIRYSPTPIANAMGPSWVDPRSGEVINASVYVFHNVVKLLNNWMFVQLSPVDPNLRTVNLPDKYRNEGLQYILRHEVGHCLGFMHNMGASSSIPVDSLRSPSFTQKYGTTYSIMDYARFNYIAQPGDKERGVRLFPPLLGLYDYFLIKWNYSCFPDAETKEDEAKILSEIVSQKAGDIRYRYGKQQGYMLDPSSQAEDLGDDVIKASEYGIKNLKYELNHLNEWVASGDKDYTYRESIWNNIIIQYFRYINHIYANIGGIYLNEKYEGDPRPFYQSVQAKKQEECLNFLLKQVYDMEWLENADIMKNMELTGTPAAYLRGKLIEALVASCIKVSLSAEKSNEPDPLTPQKCLNIIYDAVWSGTKAGKPLSSVDKELQTAFIKYLIQGAKLNDQKLSASSAITNNSFYGIELPDFVKQKCILDFGEKTFEQYFNPCATSADSDPVSGFGLGLIVDFNKLPDLESLFYGALLKAQTLMGKSVNLIKDKDTRLHYQLLLHQIDKVLD